MITGLRISVNDLGPRPGHDPHRVRMAVPTGSSLVVEVPGPGVGVAGVRGEVADRVAELPGGISGCEPLSVRMMAICNNRASLTTLDSPRAGCPTSEMVGITVATEIDLKAAINAVSDVIQNRPRPIREFDQIYMKTGDMVMQSEFIASWADGRQLAFIGDGDAISVCVAYLNARGIVNYGPSRIVVFDFDERIVQAVNRFADKERLANLEGRLYNCLDEFPDGRKFDYFYTNPPWGASNNGESANVFIQRGMEATGYKGEGMVVIADDTDLDWPKLVLGNVQRFAAENNFYVSRMMPRLHEYHLDDNPDLRSCNLTLAALPGAKEVRPSCPVTDPETLRHFYGLNQQPRVRYVRERKRVDYGVAGDAEYIFEPFESEA